MYFKPQLFRGSFVKCPELATDFHFRSHMQKRPPHSRGAGAETQEA